MSSSALRNTWIICKHECSKRIRTRSFLITTFLMPLFLAAVIGIPAVLGARANHENQKVVLVCPRQDLAESIRERLQVNTKGAYQVTLDADASEAEHQRLLTEVKAGRLDGIIWIDADSIKQGRAIYERRNARDFIWQQLVRNSVSGGFNRMRMAEYGINPDQAKTMLQGAEVELTLTGANGDRVSRD